MTRPALRIVPGELAIHKVVGICIVLLAVNDHVLKSYYSSWLTGKLSDVAGLVAAPLLMQASLEVIAFARLPAGRGLPLTLCLLVGASFIAMELTPFGDTAFRYGLAALQWPLRALMALELVPLRPVMHVADAKTYGRCHRCGSRTTSEPGGRDRMQAADSTSRHSVHGRSLSRSPDSGPGTRHPRHEQGSAAQAKPRGTCHIGGGSTLPRVIARSPAPPSAILGARTYCTLLFQHACSC